MDTTDLILFLSATNLMAVAAVLNRVAAVIKLCRK